MAISAGRKIATLLTLILGVWAASAFGQAEGVRPPKIAIDAVAPTPERSMSVSGQFIVWGNDPLRRTGFARLCDEIRGEVVAALQSRDAWKFNIVIRLRETRANPGKATRHAAPSVRPLEQGGFLFELYVLLDEDYDPAEFERELVRLLILEQMYAPHETVKFDRMPPWLLAGTVELIRYRRAGRPADVFESLIEGDQVLPIRKLMAMAPDKITDTFSRRIYDACAAALVESLLDQGSGNLRMRAFLEDLAVDDSSFDELIRRHFASLRQDPKSLEKWWLLQMATMSERSGFEYLSAAETDRFLTQALIVRMPRVETEASATQNKIEPESTERGPRFLDRLRPRAEPDETQVLEPFQQGVIHDFQQFIDHPQSAAALSFNREQLLALRDRAFPLYRNVINGYDFVIGRLMAGETRNAAEQLSQLDLQRAELQRTVTGIADHLNWYEATQIKAPHDTFKAYEKALKAIEALEAERRDDPVTRYLDAIEREFEP